MNASENRLFRLQHVTLALVFLAASLIAFLAPAVAAAQEDKMPDLLGIWQTRYATPTEEGRLVRESRYEVTRQDKELFWGNDVWHPIDPKTGKALEEWIRSPFVGSLDKSGENGLFAAKGVRFAFRLTGPDEAELEMTSFKKLGGFSPTAFYTVLKRGAVGAITRTEWPDLSGSWSGRCLAVYPDSVRPTSIRLDLVRQDGELLWMDDVWSPTGPVTEKTDPKTVLRERMQGSLNPEATGGVLVKDGVRIGFRLLSEDRMAVEFIRIGGDKEPPMAFYAVLGKGGDESPAPATEGVDLVGAWTGGYRYALPDRPVDAASSLVISRRDGNAIWAEDVWTEPGKNGAAPVQHRDPLAGSLSPDGTHGTLAKPGAYFTFRVTDADHLEFAFSSVGNTGDPAAFHGVFTRQK